MNWSRSFAVLAFLAATPAVAQPYPAEPYYAGVVPPNAVMRTVADMGLQPVSEPRLRGNVWVVRGAGREGTVVRVVLDAHTGRVIDMHAVHRPVPPGYVAGPGPYEQPAPYERDPRYVMRDQPYTPENYVPRAGQTYEPQYQGPRGAAPYDDDDDDAPRGYVPPHSSIRNEAAPHVSAKPEPKRLASKPATVPVPKARPADVTDKKNAISKEDVKKEDVKKDAAKQEEKQHEEAKHEEPKPADVKHEPARPLTSPKSSEAKAAEAKSAAAKSETTGSIPEKKKDVAPTKKTELPPVQPLE